MLYQDDMSGFALSMDDQTNFIHDFGQNAKNIWDAFVLGLNRGDFPFLTIAQDSHDLEQATSILNKFSLNAHKRLLILGTGGSSLSGQTLLAIHRHRFWAGYGPSIDFLDNVDPHTFNALTEGIDPHNTAVVAISKSGETAETLCQLLTLMDHYRAHGISNLGQSFIVVTEDKPSTLKKLCDENTFSFLPHPKTIGGRFSGLSIVGLLPLMMAGYDGANVRAGAARYLKDLIDGDMAHNGPLTAAIWAGILTKKQGVTGSVMMPYVDRLIPFSAWYCQLWGESLGKGGRGITPLRALGTVDQHSQLQLYLDGPKDKMITLIGTQTTGIGTPLNSVNFKGKTMGDLMAAELKATYQTLKNNGCPVRLITIPDINNESIGALLAGFMVELVLTAAVLDIGAPFDQDAVEESKRLTRLYLEGPVQ